MTEIETKSIEKFSLSRTKFDKNIPYIDRVLKYILQ